ncbi:MAG: restriction endonuclease subunit S [Euryarchaeota archaeon]|nr:restriction endonuclease subunit S [Euryarchaeota archaeon]
MSEWKEYKWGDLATLEYGKGLIDYQRENGKYPVYGTNGKIGTSDVFLCPYPGIVIGRKGAYRGVHFSNTPFYVIDTAFYLNPKVADLDMKFAYYQLLTVDINYMDSGSAIPSTSREDFYDLDIMLPPLPEQHSIASILSSLDDKIDLLHRQNKTLEALAQTLFRQWFMEEAEGGWEERPLSSIANFLNGLACQKFPPKNEIDKLPVLKIKELSSGISESSDWAATEVSPEYIVQGGDVIFAWSASLMVKVWDGEKCVLNQHLFKVTSSEFPKWFYLAWCKYHLAEFISISLSHATTMGHIKRGDLDAVMVLVPSDNEISAMSEKMTPLLDKQIVNARQIRTLTRLRDTLLPKLMSGEVRIE